MNTKQSRSRLPEFLRHEEAAAAAAQSALLGAAIASGDAALLADAFHDRLHEPFRAADAPLLEELRSRIRLPGSVGVTLSGSGPSVVVWAEKDQPPTPRGSSTCGRPESRIASRRRCRAGGLAVHGAEPPELSV